ncbi:MAG: type I-C CRISPR-associated protein Cas8c/Csd1, partial [Candidatus Omnitrophica bacterium]|nr:type I-C CRISPR-associated protein Cas8c/Csd1 [Candidatus Omnitrophota bacterium]
IVCDQAGNFLNVQELGDPDDKNNRGKLFPVCPDLSLPEMKAGGSGCRHFLVDNVEVVTLLGKNGDVRLDSVLEDKDRKKAVAKHAFFASLLRKAEQVAPELSALANVLDSNEWLAAVQKAFSEKRYKPTDNVTFAVTGRAPMFIVEDNVWHEWWREFRSALGAGKSDKQDEAPEADGEEESVGSMRCFGSGELVDPVPVWPKVEGLSDVGGLSMGDALASFKQESFGSYFLSQSSNCAVSEDIAAASRAGLNDLIKLHSRRLTGSKVVHWYAGKDSVPDDLDPLSWLVDVEDEDGKERDAQKRAASLLDSVRSGGRADLLEYRFYAMTLSGASGRVMVRDWMEGRFDDLAANIDAWFDDLSIVQREGGELAKRPKFLAVLGGLVRDLKDIPPPVEAKMWRVAVRNEAIPQFVLAQALIRVRVDIIQDEPVSHARMGLLKAYHKRKGDMDMQPYLNEEHPSPAYHCGRLMAVYADLQRAALGDVGAGVVQRYYAAASSTPALILGRLGRGGQFHLNKLDSGLAHWYEQRLASVWGRIKDELPRTLSLEEQGLFALGYYQQKAVSRKKNDDLKVHTQQEGE